MAQRLVRTLCPHCREPHQLTEQEKLLLAIPAQDNPTIYRPKGCEECNYSGYRGRTGIHELLLVDEAVREAIHAEAGELSIERMIRAHTPSIRSDGLDKVMLGITSLEEVLRVTRED